MIHIARPAAVSKVVSLDNARIRKAKGQKLVDTAGAVDPRTRIKPATYAKTPTNLVIYVREIGWVKGVLHARYIMGGAYHSIPVTDLTPAPLPANL